MSNWFSTQVSFRRLSEGRKTGLVRNQSKGVKRMPTVELKHGDIFDGPSDLIVLPCSTGGTITGFVRERLVHHNIPYPKPGMKLGDVSIMAFDGGENIAQYVAFAASVEHNASLTSAIERIGEQLGKATKDKPTIRLVSAPLLGAGAGHLKS